MMTMMTDGLDDSNDWICNLFPRFLFFFFFLGWRSGIGIRMAWHERAWSGLVLYGWTGRFSFFLLLPRHENLELRQLYSLSNFS